MMIANVKVQSIARRRTRRRLCVLAGALVLLAAGAGLAGAQSARSGAAHGTTGDASAAFSLEQMLSYPYTEQVAAADSGSRIAWIVNQRGVRNIWVAEGPELEPRALTSYREDDGQELTYLALSPKGDRVLWVRGGDHDANWPAEGGLQPDPNHSPVQPKVQIWSAPFDGGTPKLIVDGDEPVISPRGDRIAFIRDHQVWVVPVDGSAEAKRLFFAKGESRSPVWSPSGDRLAFVSDREDHRFIGIFTSDSTPILYIDPTTSRDGSPVWSRDGKRIAFVRQPGRGGAPETLLERHPEPWSIWVGDATTGAAHRVWQSPNTLLGSIPSTAGGPNLGWGAGDRIVFLADLDGWAHLYSIPERGGAPLLLTPGKFMVEHVALARDGSAIIYNANTGTTRGDIDRRHLFRVPVDRAAPEALTSGEGLEWAPVPTGDGRSIVFIGATWSRPPLPAVIPIAGGEAHVLSEDLIPSTFPASALVVPKPVVFKAADGTEVHGQLFASNEGRTRKPGIIFVHGGPPRQMLLGWHYMNYYSNGYAVNQYLATHGYVVLSVNYRLGIGYGELFHNPAHAGPWGASEYQDVQAGARFLQAQPGVDASRIGIWGGSYGGYLTALALARNSDVFKAGVDLHGVHDWVADIGRYFGVAKERYEKADVDEAIKVAWKASPVSSISTWKSPVLLIQGDDDRNVQFHQTVDLARRLSAAQVPYDELVIPDEIHGFLRYATWVTVDSATVAYFDEKLGGRGSGKREVGSERR